jgi:predicted metal-dependent enzyme (double-stranded beta helix superfamily)
MYDALTTANAAWRVHVLATINACIEQDGSPSAGKIAEALAYVAAWHGCPHAAALSCASSPSAYRRIPLGSSEAHGYEALLILWPPAYATPIHDHDELWGMEFVLDGVLEVESFQLLAQQASMHLSPTHTLLAGVGDYVAFSNADYAHRCRNVSRNRQALSLHVYGGALNQYRSFHQQDGQWSSKCHTTAREPSLA